MISWNTWDFFVMSTQATVACKNESCFLFFRWVGWFLLWIFQPALLCMQLENQWLRHKEAQVWNLSMYYWCLTVKSNHPNDNNKLLNLVLHFLWTLPAWNPALKTWKKTSPRLGKQRGNTQDLFSLPLCCTETLQVACRGRGQRTRLGVEPWHDDSWHPLVN